MAVRAVPERLIADDVDELRTHARYLLRVAMEGEDWKALAALSRQYRLTVREILDLDNSADYYGEFLSSLAQLKEQLEVGMAESGATRDIAALSRQFTGVMSDIRQLTAERPVPTETSPVEAALAAVEAMASGR